MIPLVPQPLNVQSRIFKSFKLILWIVIFTTIYFYSGKLGLSLAYVNVSTSAVWPPTGVALAAALIWGYRIWPAVFIGSFLVNNTTHCPWVTSLGVATGDTLEALVAAGLVRKFANGLGCFDRAKTTFRYFLVAPIFSTMFSASIGVLSLGLVNSADWHHCWVVWSTWWIGNMTSDFVIAPLLIVWMTTRSPKWSAGRILEACALIYALVLLGQFVFLGASLHTALEQLEFLVFPPLLWAIFRFGPSGTTASVFVISIFAIWSALRQSGPFVASDPNESLLMFQAFAAVISVTGLLLAAVIAEREKNQLRLKIKDSTSRVIAESSGPIDAVPKFLRVICENADWDFGAMWQLDSGTNKLLCSEVWSSPLLKFTEFGTITQIARFDPGICLPGRVWRNGKLAWISDLSRDDNFSRASEALKAGLHSAVCFSLKCDGDTLGVIECFGRTVHEPDRDFIQMLERLGDQIGQFIQRRRVEGELREANQLYQQIVVGAKEGIIVNGPDLKHLVWNPFMETLTGVSAAEAVGKHPEEIFPFLRDAGVINQMNRALAGETCPSLEINFQVPNGVRTCWVTNTSSPLRNAKGETIGVITIVTDITERKRMEENLNEAHWMLASMCDVSTDAIFIKDFLGRYLLANKVAAKVMCKKTEEIIGKDDGFLFPSINAEKFRETDRKVMDSGQVMTYEEEVPTTNGIVTFLTTKGPIYDAKGKASGLFGISRDITVRKQAEKVLQESEARLRLINEQVPAIIWTVDGDLKFTSVTGLAAAGLKTRAEELVGRSLYEVYRTTEENYPGLVAHRRALEGERNSVELQFNDRFWRCNIEPMVGHYGKIIGCIGVAINITATKKTEARLQELAAIVQNSEDAIISVTQEAIVVSWNKAAERLFGYDLEEMVGKSARVIFPPEQFNESEHIISKVLRGESVEGYEALRLRKDGTLRSVSVRVSGVTDPTGKITGMAAIYRDITELKQLEKAVVEISSNERRRIGYDLHDGLGQHLAGIAFKAKALEEALAGKFTGLANEASIIVSLLNEGISQTRSLASGLDPVEIEVAGLPAALQKAAAQAEENFQVHCEFKCAQNRTIVEKQTGLILYHITQEAIHNAVTHGKAKHVVIELETDTHKHCLRIKDDGTGIDVQGRPQSGMGLRIMQYRANSVGGRLTINSQINAGTEVVCIVPLGLVNSELANVT
jgi:PAS domain S-box-containing protein